MAKDGVVDIFFSKDVIWYSSEEEEDRLQHFGSGMVAVCSSFAAMEARLLH